MSPAEAERYHHGDLPNALRRAAADVVAERGAAGFSLREVARRAGVSHAAPAHHFGDATGLLTSVAIEALQHMHAAVTAAADGMAEPRQRLVAMGRAYVEVSVSNPGHCAVAFRHDLVHEDDPEYLAASDAAHGAFFDAVAAIAEDEGLDFDLGAATSLGWATLQGLVELYPNMEDIGSRHGQGSLPPIGVVAEQFGEMLIEGMTSGATPSPS
ncbi:MAG: TetR/AcrR family transcriptional regulator [Actinomycetota bacterium]